jgi:hypothetical protein
MAKIVNERQAETMSGQTGHCPVGLVIARLEVSGNLKPKVGPCLCHVEHYPVGLDIVR